MLRLTENTYGKCRVRVVRVKRDSPLHHLQEWTVEVLLTGEFFESFTDGDNSRILATDTMKNTVYSLARDTKADSIETFGLELSGWLMQHNLQVDTVRVSINSVRWMHIATGQITYPSAFMQSGGELQTTTIARARKQERPEIIAGLDNLVIMKSAMSGFEGFIRDAHTTLPETSDRLLGTALRAEWKYCSLPSEFESLRSQIRNSLLATFAEHESKSVQHTLYAMATKVLDKFAEIQEIKIVMPNKHCLLVDLSRFGQTNPNEIFVPTDEPYGYIEARVCREVEP